MVSTRGPKSRYFEKGELVLCYEPDVTKAKVLYDSKILGIYESKDKRGRKIIQYKVHFQGWSSSWDRKVNADFVLKDTEENRQLQRDLAEKAHLHLGAYLYRKDRSITKKRSRKVTTNRERRNSLEYSSASSVVAAEECSRAKKANRLSITEEKNSSANTIDKHEDQIMKEDEGDSNCSSFESYYDDERILLRISERLRQYLEYDYHMALSGRMYILPARVSIVAILDNFVRQTTANMIYSFAQNENTRRRILQRTDKKEREFDKLVMTVNLLKEVADGLRIYFDFTLTDYLLYDEEREYVLSHLSEEKLKNFTYVTFTGLLPDNNSSDSEQLPTINMDSGAESQSSIIATETTPPNVTANANTNDNTTPTSLDEPLKRKLRSYRSDDGDNLSSVASNSSGASTPLHTNSINCNSRCLETMTNNLPTHLNKFLQDTLSWQMLPENTAPLPSMIFGAIHLARLLVKLPEFLNACAMNDEKLKLLLSHLDTFINYLESRKDWFSEDNYEPDTNVNGTSNQSSSTKLKFRDIDQIDSNKQINQEDQDEDAELLNIEICEDGEESEEECVQLVNGYKPHIYATINDMEYDAEIQDDDIELEEHEVEYVDEDYLDEEHENNLVIQEEESQEIPFTEIKQEVHVVEDDLIYQMEEIGVNDAEINKSKEERRA